MLLIIFSVVTIGVWIVVEVTQRFLSTETTLDYQTCLLYTSDAADDLLCVDLGGRRIIKKKNIVNANASQTLCIDMTRTPRTVTIHRVLVYSRSQLYVHLHGVAQ